MPAYIGAQPRNTSRHRNAVAILRFARALPQKRPRFRCFRRNRMTDFATLRRHMVDGQVRTADVTDLRRYSRPCSKFRASASCRRRRPVSPISISICRSARGRPPAAQADGACENDSCADIASSDRVLDVGCATGYAAAMLSRIAGQVIALEQDAGLAQTARAAASAAQCERCERAPDRRLAARRTL